MKKTIGICAAALISVVAFSSLPANAGILETHFGVTLSLDPGQYDSYQKTTTYPFNLNSFAPTLNTETADYVVGDWYGHWSKTNFSYSTIRGAYAESGEPYDVEALYFDNDASYLYIAVVTSFPGPPGYQEPRIGGSPLVMCGDLALDLGLNPNHSSADKFGYDFGVNINNEHRTSGNATSGGSSLGTGVYRTANGDWYVGTPGYASAAGGEYTNFDPNHAGFTGTLAGNATTSFYEYVFADGKTENGLPTYVLEATISRSLLGNLQDGDTVGISFVEGCRNDGDQHSSILRFAVNPDVDDPQPAPVPEPMSLTLLGIGAAMMLVRRKRS